MSTSMLSVSWKSEAAAAKKIHLFRNIKIV
jgi:hypothetical protein